MTAPSPKKQNKTKQNKTKQQQQKPAGNVNRPDLSGISFSHESCPMFLTYVQLTVVASGLASDWGLKFLAPSGYTPSLTQQNIILFIT